MFKFGIDDLNFEYFKKFKFYLLYVNLTAFGKMRFGDFVFLSVILYWIKIYLISQSKGKLNFKNFYFVPYFNNDDIYIDDILSIFGYFRNIYFFYNKTFDNYNHKYSINLVLNNFNIWSFKEYFNIYNFKIDNKALFLSSKHDILTLPKIKISKNKIIIFPVIGKEYNSERNFNINIFIDIFLYLRKLHLKNDIIIVNYRDLFKKNIDMKYLNKNNFDFKVVTFSKWIDVINFIIKNAVFYISGDCGMSHFVATIPQRYRPNIILKYKTNNILYNKRNLSHIIDTTLLSGIIDFIPYCPYQNSNLFIL